MSPPTRTGAKPHIESKYSTDSRASMEHNACTTLGILQRRWWRVKRSEEPETLFVMVKRNYKIYANIGFNRRSTRRFTAVLNTGAGPSFIRNDVLPERTWNCIQAGAPENVILDKNNRLVNFFGFIDLFVDIFSRSKLVWFNLVECFAASVIICCECYDVSI